MNDELYKLDPVSIFLMERDNNKAFNKCLLSQPEIKHLIDMKWPGLQATGKTGIPFLMGSTPVLSNARIGE